MAIRPQTAPSRRPTTTLNSSNTNTNANTRQNKKHSPSSASTSNLSPHLLTPQPLRPIPTALHETFAKSMTTQEINFEKEKAARKEPPAKLTYLDSSSSIKFAKLEQRAKSSIRDSQQAPHRFCYSDSMRKASMARRREVGTGKFKRSIRLLDNEEDVGKYLSRMNSNLDNTEQRREKLALIYGSKSSWGQQIHTRRLAELEARRKNMRSGDVPCKPVILAEESYNSQKIATLVKSEVYEALGQDRDADRIELLLQKMKATVVLQRCVRAFQKRLWSRRFGKIDPVLRGLVQEEFELAKEVFDEAKKEKLAEKEVEVEEDSMLDITEGGSVDIVKNTEGINAQSQLSEEEKSVINIGSAGISDDEDDCLFGANRGLPVRRGYDTKGRRLSTMNPLYHKKESDEDKSGGGGGGGGGDNNSVVSNASYTIDNSLVLSSITSNRQGKQNNRRETTHLLHFPGKHYRHPATCDEIMAGTRVNEIEGTMKNVGDLAILEKKRKTSQLVKAARGDAIELREKMINKRRSFVEEISMSPHRFHQGRGGGFHELDNYNHEFPSDGSAKQPTSPHKGDRSPSPLQSPTYSTSSRGRDGRMLSTLNPRNSSYSPPTSPAAAKEYKEHRHEVDLRQSPTHMRRPSSANAAMMRKKTMSLGEYERRKSRFNNPDGKLASSRHRPQTAKAFDNKVRPLRHMGPRSFIKKTDSDAKLETDVAVKFWGANNRPNLMKGNSHALLHRKTIRDKIEQEKKSGKLRE